jgi:hypothetical protein
MPMTPHIATASIEEGLDFACNLVSSAISAKSESSPEMSKQLLHELVRYIELRYVGEPLLALEYIAGLGNACDPAAFRSEQFWAQLRWVAGQMNLKSEEFQRLQLPSA